MLTRTHSTCIAGQRRQNALRADILTPKPRPTSVRNCPTRVGSCLGPLPNHRIGAGKAGRWGRWGRGSREEGGVEEEGCMGLLAR